MPLKASAPAQSNRRRLVWRHLNIAFYLTLTMSLVELFWTGRVEGLYFYLAASLVFITGLLVWQRPASKGERPASAR